MLGFALLCKWFNSFVLELLHCFPLSLFHTATSSQLCHSALSFIASFRHSRFLSSLRLTSLFALFSLSDSPFSSNSGIFSDIETSPSWLKGLLQQNGLSTTSFCALPLLPLYSLSLQLLALCHSLFPPCLPPSLLPVTCPYLNFTTQDMSPTLVMPGCQD